MPAVRKSRSSSSHSHSSSESRPKLFQCTGFGDCHMVFTRSEHLARHTRKHTGEKPYQCIVPGCTRMFSRWDNMMQHTQTHRTTTSPHPNQQQPRKQHQEQASTTRVYQGGLMSPVSLGSPEQASWSSSDEDAFEEINEQQEQEERPQQDNEYNSDHQEEDEEEVQKQRRLSVADLCNPIHLTLDEFEALEGFARFRETPLFYESLRDLATIACIEPKPSSAQHCYYAA
ncbi:hypothetical protein BDB00DRAFT_860632 [Zychaea mexicana]|uniref:uncharacterized protein n=1 Tax=Zychaea mexicana TaxID=64656 RepID=UPI0022FE04EF|nr:uncharacterized protein BDB00DRAFT_860632 [Zychaea mexicana]KAI9474326.1 hypothetical protein BDB00DRAFT_860632 [Zychaea mexicana]